MLTAEGRNEAPNHGVVAALFFMDATGVEWIRKSRSQQPPPLLIV
jgi:hypothetical protein